MVMQTVTDLKFTVKKPDQEKEEEKGYTGLTAEKVLWVGLWVKFQWAVSNDNGGVAVAAAVVLAIRPG